MSWRVGKQWGYSTKALHWDLKGDNSGYDGFQSECFHVYVFELERRIYGRIKKNLWS